MTPPPLPCPQLCASPVLPGAGYAGPHTGKGLGSLSLACRQLRASHLLLSTVSGLVPRRKPLQQKESMEFLHPRGCMIKHTDQQLVRARWSHRRYLTLHKKCALARLTVTTSGPVSEDSLQGSESQEQALRLKANKLYRLWKQEKPENQKQKGRVLFNGQPPFILFTLQSLLLIQWPTAAHQFAALFFLNLLILFSTFL